MMDLDIENVNYNFLLLSIAKKFGLETLEAFEFYNFVLDSADHFAIQKKYKEIYEKVLAEEEE